MNRFENIRQWADDRGLIKNSTPQAQMMKLIEELGELSVAIQKGKRADTIDALGDSVVVLTILAAQLGFELEECINAVLNKYKKEQYDTTTPNKKYLRAKEVARYLGIGLSTVWLYAKQGRMTPKKISSKITVFDIEEVEKLANA